MIIERLKQLRSIKGLSQPEMAEVLNIPLTTYRSYEQGKREPSHELLVKISKALNTSIDYLLGNDDPPLESFNPIVSQVDTFTQAEKDFVNNFLKLTPDERNALLEAMKKIICS